MDWISDMYFAAALLAYGAELEEIDRADIKHQKFKFGGSIEQIFIIEPGTKVILRVENPEFSFIKMKYIGRTLMLPPEYIDSVRSMKAAVHGY